MVQSSSIGPEDVGDLLRISRHTQRQRQQDARLLRQQVIGDQEPRIGQSGAAEGTPAAGARALHHDNALRNRLLESLEIARWCEAWSESGRDDALGAGSRERTYGGAVAAHIR